MEQTYANIILSAADCDEVVLYLDSKHCPSFVYAADEHICVFPKQGQFIHAIAESLSITFACVALAVSVTDDSVFTYLLYDGGELIDDYDSCPGYLTGQNLPPNGGNAELLALKFGVPDAVSKLEDILRKQYAFESNRHDGVLAALDLPYCTVGGDFGALKEKIAPDGLDLEFLRETRGDGTDVFATSTPPF